MEKFTFMYYSKLYTGHIFLQTIDVLQNHVKMAGHVPWHIMGINVSADPDIAEITVKVCISLVQHGFH